MAKVITYSQIFPSYHPRKGDKTNFAEKFWNSFNVFAFGEEFIKPFDDELNQLNKHLPYYLLDEFKKNIKQRSKIGKKFHTIREGKRFKVGEWFSPRVWSGRPYFSKQIILAPDLQITKIYDIKIEYDQVFINNKLWSSAPSISRSAFMWLANNDGLTSEELYYWLRMNEGKKFEGQIICWTDKQFTYHEKPH